MSMARSLVLAALLVAAPSLASRRSDTSTEAVRQELTRLEHLTRRVPDTRLRQNMEDSLARLDGLLAAEVPTRSTEELLRMVEAERFDSAKVEVIRRLARTTRFTSEQAALLASRCAFDSGRSEALLAMYPSVVDPWRFEIAVQVLTFESSRRALWESIEGSHR